MSDDICSGVVRRIGEGFEGVLEREYDHPPQALWRMLTEPSEFAKWLAPGSMELREGGTVRIDFVDSGTLIESPLTRCVPPRVLQYSWSSGSEPARPLRWELAPTAGGTRLILVVSIPAGEDVAKACAGFEGHLDMLAGALEGVAMRFPFDHYVAARKAYQQMLGV